MKPISYLKTLLEYNHLANVEVVRALRQLDPLPDKARDIASHLAAAEDLWYNRISKKPPSMAVWPSLSLGEIDAALRQQHDRWMLMLDHLDETLLSKPVSYTNSKGVPWANRIDEILTHVVIHSSHHRGQLALLLSSEQMPPPNVDFIHCAREGLVDEWI